MRRERLTHMKKRLREATRTQRELEKRMFHLKTLYDVSREIGFLIDTQAIMKNLLMMVIGTFGVERGLILLVDVRENQIQAVTHRGLDDATAAALTRVVDAGFLSNVQASLNLHVWIPFEVNEYLKGGIGLGEKLTGDAYTPDDSELLVTLANQGAIAIKNATVHEEVVRYAKELAASLRRIQLQGTMQANLAKVVTKTGEARISETP